MRFVSEWTGVNWRDWCQCIWYQKIWCQYCIVKDVLIYTYSYSYSYSYPFLFLIYISDLPQTLENNKKFAILADDKAIIKSGKGIYNMQNDLDKLRETFNYNKLSLKASKCETTSFGSTNQNTLTIHNEPVSQKICSKYLGVFIDSKLTFRDHINHVVKKIFKFLLSNL